MPSHIDYAKEAEFRTRHLNLTGGSAAEGLTVRDYMAAKAMGALLTKVSYKEWGEVASAAYALADSMLEKRGELK